MTQTSKGQKVAAITYVIFFWPFLVGAKRDEFVKYHLKQAIGLVIFALAGQGVISICNYWGAGSGFIKFLVWVLRILLVIGVVTGIRNALAGKVRPLPYIGKYAEKLEK